MASLKKIYFIEYVAKNGAVRKISTTINEFKIYDGIEYMLLTGGEIIRLDNIILFNNLTLKSIC